MKKFKFYDYTMLISPTGQKASNLKEFLNIIEQSEDKVLFHHLYQSHARYDQRVGEFPNDFANWAAYDLEDLALAEKLANFDPYDYKTVAEAKEALVTIIEEHMWDLPTIPWVRKGSEFYFSSATTVITPLGIEVSDLKGFRDALNEIPASSLYFHFYETRKIKKEKEHDDFSVWIEDNFDKKELVRKFREIDFYFFSVEEVRKKLINIMNKELKGTK
ncbi:MAG: DUF5752 family protein [Actinomycetota bacterium]|nr:DUF5752 family protein [Actinomycetota bacterium]